MSNQSVKCSRRLDVAIVVVLLWLLPSLAGADVLVPPDMAYQGLVLDDQGEPVAGPIDLRISIFEAMAGGSPLYTEEFLATALEQGVFHVLLGTGTNQSPLGGFDEPLFAGQNRWLELEIDGETLSPRQPFSSVAYSFRTARAQHAELAADASTLEGQSAQSLDQSAHAASAGNPHGVHPAQIGAATDVAFQAHTLTSSIHQARYTDAEAISAAGGAGIDAGTLDTIDSSGFVQQGEAGSVTSAMIADGTIVGADIQDGSITEAELNIGQLDATLVDTVGVKTEVFEIEYSVPTTLLKRTGGSTFGVGMGESGGQEFFYVVNETAAEFLLVVDDAGKARVNKLELLGGADIAEPFDVSGSESVPPGTVLVIDPDHPGQLTPSLAPYDFRVAGIASGAGGVESGLSLRQEGTLDGAVEVALSGRVYVRADTSGGAIRPGDLLTTSTLPGRAMRAADPDRARGAVIGKAMTPLGEDEDEGLVLVLVSLQ